MKPHLRWYQQDLKNQIYQAWQDPDVKNVIAVAPTGAGKTVTLGSVAHDFPTGVTIAHRQELVSQISIALAREGLVHNLICSDSTRKAIQQFHVQETGRRWVDKNAPWHVSGVDTLIRHSDDPWMQNISLVIQDEAHHVLRGNKWGKAWEKFPNSRGLGLTATPDRTDGKGLGRDFDGVFDSLVQTVGMRELIDQGYLTDYVYIGDPEALKGIENSVHTGASGDFKAQELSDYFKQNTQITGDIVKHYLHYAPGKLGVTFAVDISHANEIADAFRKAGVPAEVLSGKTPDALRRNMLRRFANREFLQLVSVDILGEGFDLPAIEVISFGRPTQSYSLYTQQWGRVLRLMVDRELLDVWEELTVSQRLEYIAQSRKPKAIILDHVGNLYRHQGPPDKLKAWSLASRGKNGGTGGGIPLRLCLNAACLKSYQSHLSRCPHCLTPAPEPEERGRPDEVAGDLSMYTPEILAQLRGEAARIDQTAKVPYGAPMHIKALTIERHHDRVRNQMTLRKAMNDWSAKYPELSQTEKERLFFYTFGMDALTALTLNGKESLILAEKLFTAL